MAGKEVAAVAGSALTVNVDPPATFWRACWTPPVAFRPIAVTMLLARTSRTAGGVDTLTLGRAPAVSALAFSMIGSPRCCPHDAAKTAAAPSAAKADDEKKE